MAPNNKLAYLAKYGVGEDGDKSKKEKKKHKREKKMKHPGGHQNGRSSSGDRSASEKRRQRRHPFSSSYIQDMDDMNAFLPDHDETTSDAYEEGGGPTVVEMNADHVDNSLHSSLSSKRRGGGKGTGFVSVSLTHHNEQSHDDHRDSNDNGTNKKSRRKRHDSDSDSAAAEAKRRRHDSDSDDVDDNNNRLRKGGRRRHDSSSSEGSSEGEVRKHRKNSSASHKRHDSSTSDDNDDDDDDDSNENKKFMSSGHKAGLVTSTDFAKTEKIIRKRQRDELERNKFGTEKVGETVYRDISGKKTKRTGGGVAMQDELQRRREEEERELHRQQEANKGAYQILQQEERRKELEDAAGMTLARGIEDEQMEQRKKATIRDGDPMAMYAWKKQQQEEASSQHNAANNHLPQKKPVYKGPPPKSNRYGIRPGYRWDGTDRGNGFEDKVLEALHSKGRKKEEAYKWSAADM